MTVSAPVELTSRSQWVGWRFVIREGPDGLPKPTKVPINCLNGSNASTTDPGTWCSFDQAVAFVEAERLDGIGYVLSPDDPYTGVDLDHCRNADTGEIEEWAAVIAFRLDSYTEISPSGTGLRIFVRGALPPHGRRKGHIEVYSQARFLTITGNVLPDAPERIEDRQEELSQWHLEVFGPTPSERASSPAVARMPIQLADADLLKKARGADNGEKFWALWNGDWSSSYGSQSEADLALVSHLAFYTGPDEARLDTLFRSSGLMREKWDRSGYRNSTINKALDGRTEFYGNGNLALAPRLSVNGIVHTSDSTVDTATGEVVDKYPWMTLGDLMSRPYVPYKQIIEGLLWDGRTHWLYSSPGAGKTMLSLCLGLHIAAGKPFMGRAVEQGTVLLIEEDSSDDVIQEYVMSLEQIYGIDANAVPFIMNNERGRRLSDPGSFEKWQTDILRVRERYDELPKLIILDACERISPSGDYGSKDYDQLSRLVTWCQSQRITLIVIDHTRKNLGKDEDHPDPVDFLYGGRPKSIIGDLYMFLKGNLQTSLMLQFTKQRIPKPSDIEISFDDGEGFDLKQDSRKPGKSEQKVLRLIQNAPSGKLWSREELEHQTGLQTRNLQLILAKMVDARWISQQGEGRATRYGRSGGAPSSGVFAQP